MMFISSTANKDFCKTPQAHIPPDTNVHLLCHTSLWNTYLMKLHTVPDTCFIKLTSVMELTAELLRETEMCSWEQRRPTFCCHSTHSALWLRPQAELFGKVEGLFSADSFKNLQLRDCWQSEKAHSIICKHRVSEEISWSFQRVAAHDKEGLLSALLTKIRSQSTGGCRRERVLQCRLTKCVFMHVNPV